ncbi:MAG: hypothetical protein HYT93_00980 [Parcubacteria group bacterium]|nr:hypothetical protein [Parcubacteria group bacterium]
MRILKSSWGLVIAIALLSILKISPALGSHEGPYVIGETKHIKNVWVCTEEKPLQDAVAALPDWDIMLETISESVECFYLSITLEVRVLGQIGKDKVDENGVLYRIVSVKNPIHNSNLYLLVMGSETKVISPSRTL